MRSYKKLLKIVKGLFNNEDYEKLQENPGFFLGTYENDIIWQELNICKPLTVGSYIYLGKLNRKMCIIQIVGKAEISRAGRINLSPKNVHIYNYMDPNDNYSNNLDFQLLRAEEEDWFRLIIMYMNEKGFSLKNLRKKDFSI